MKRLWCVVFLLFSLCSAAVAAETTPAPDSLLRPDNGIYVRHIRTYDLPENEKSSGAPQ